MKLQLFFFSRLYAGNYSSLQQVSGALPVVQHLSLNRTDFPLLLNGIFCGICERLWSKCERDLMQNSPVTGFVNRFSK